jgi:hypothetical protein
MTERNSSKPPKPYPAFPVTPHPNGRWCKKIRHSGRRPVEDPDALTVLVLCARFLTHKKNARETGAARSISSRRCGRGTRDNPEGTGT